MAKNKNAVALGHIGGKKTSEAKTRAARENGKKGGRPRCKKLYARGVARSPAYCDRVSGHKGLCSGDYQKPNSQRWM
jgi:hypothetical protein